MTRWRYWLTKLREAALSTLPIFVVVITVFLIEKFALSPSTFEQRYWITDADILLFSMSAIMVVFGIMLFSIGTESSMTEIGHLIGGSLVKKKNFFFVVVMTFMLGVLVTVAEPDLAVLSGQIGINEQILIWTIGVGVGIFLVVGVLRVMFHKSLNIMFLAFYGLVFALGYIIDPRFLPICFDSGGVTTGPVTVPFLLGFGMGMAASRGGQSSEDSFGLTALCSVGPIIAVTLIAAIMKFAGKDLPSMSEFADPMSQIGGDMWMSLGKNVRSVLIEVAFSVVPILLFFLVYELIFIRLPWLTVLRVMVGMIITFIGLVCFLTAVKTGFMPIASKVGQSFGTVNSFFPWVLLLGALFGIFGVLAEPAVQVLVTQIEQISEGTLKKWVVLIVLAVSIGAAVVLHLLRTYFSFSVMYYLVPGYILAFVLSFLVPKIYTAMAFDSGGVASGPMTSTFVLPFCIGFAYARGTDVYLYGFGLVGLVALMPLIVLQALGLINGIKQQAAYQKARKRIVEENDDQIVHLPLEEASNG